MKKIIVILVAVIGFGISANAQKVCIADGVCYAQATKNSSTKVTISIDDVKNQRTVVIYVEQQKDNNGGPIYNVWCTGYRKVVAKTVLAVTLNSAIATATGGTSVLGSAVIAATSNYAYDQVCEYLKENNY